MTLFSLFLLFLKIGAFTFGGGYAMLPLMQEELLRRGVMDETAIVDFLAVSESTPGPFAVNAATYVGYTVGGFPGALLATLGVVLPSFLVILTLAGCLSRLRASARGELLFTGAMGGLKPAVTGMIGAALLSAASSVFFPSGLSAALPPSSLLPSFRRDLSSLRPPDLPETAPRGGSPTCSGAGTVRRISRDRVKCTWGFAPNPI